MRIVNRAEFLEMPEGTLYSKYAPCYFADFQIKQETLSFMTDKTSGDWLCSNIIDAIDCIDCGEYGDKLKESEETGVSIKMDYDCLSRDGCFDRNQLFAVYEAEDIRKLIGKLSRLAVISDER